MATVYDIVRGINQAAANAYDGNHKGTIEQMAKMTLSVLREKKAVLSLIPESWTALKLESLVQY